MKQQRIDNFVFNGMLTIRKASHHLISRPKWQPVTTCMCVQRSSSQLGQNHVTGGMKGVSPGFKIALLF
jgi:hypothetical protein